MTDLPSSPPADAPRDPKKLLVAGLVAVLVLAGLWFLASRWWRRGGARRVVTELAEEGAVRLADVVVDEILGAAKVA